MPAAAAQEYEVLKQSLGCILVLDHQLETEDLKKLYNNRKGLSIYKGVFVMGNRIVVLASMQNEILGLILDKYQLINNFHKSHRTSMC